MSDNQPAVKHYYVDEAGDPALFSGGGKVLIGSGGCSRHFAIGLLDVLELAVNWEAEKLYDVEVLGPFDEF